MCVPGAVLQGWAGAFPADAFVCQGNSLWIYTLPFANAPTVRVEHLQADLKCNPSPWKDIPFLALFASPVHLRK